MPDVDGDPCLKYRLVISEALRYFHLLRILTIAGLIDFDEATMKRFEEWFKEEAKKVGVKDWRRDDAP